MDVKERISKLTDFPLDSEIGPLLKQKSEIFRE